MKDDKEKLQEAKELYYSTNSISPLDERFNILQKRKSQKVISFLGSNKSFSGQLQDDGNIGYENSSGSDGDEG